MLLPQTIDVVERFWAQRLGCERRMLSQAGVTIVPRENHASSVLVWARGETIIVSTPRDVATAFSDRDAMMEEQGLRRLLGDRVQMVVGPAYVGYADGRNFHGGDETGVRLLGEADGAAVERLRCACGAVEWELSGIGDGGQPAAGKWVDGELAAVGAYEVWGESIAHMLVITHPGHRGRGHGTGAVSVMTRAALERSLVPQYRTLEANGPSVALADSLGFVRAARTMAVRLR